MASTSSSTDWLEPIPILQSVLPLISTASDLEHVSDTQRLMEERDQERMAELHSVESELRALNKKLSQASSQAVRPPSVPSAESHRLKIEALDKQKFALAKTINEKEVALTGIEGKAGKLKEEGEELIRERKEALENSEDLDSEAIRLNLLQSLGFTFLPPTEPSAPRQILVRNDHLDDVTVVEGLAQGEETDRAKKRALADRLWGLTGDGVET